MGLISSKANTALLNAFQNRHMAIQIMNTPQVQSDLLWTYYGSGLIYKSMASYRSLLNQS